MLTSLEVAVAVIIVMMILAAAVIIATQTMQLHARLDNSFNVANLNVNGSALVVDEVNALIIADFYENTAVLHTASGNNLDRLTLITSIFFEISGSVK